METMTLTINVPKNVGIILEEKAKFDGKELVEYVEEIIKNRRTNRLFAKLFADILRSEVLSDEDLETEIDTAIEELR